MPKGVGPWLDFRMAEAARDDAWLREEAARVVALVVATLGPAEIRALVLSGSVARGEGAVLWKTDGCAFPLADLDLYVVIRSDGRPGALAALREKRHELLARLAEGRLRADVGIATAQDLATLPPTLGNLALVADGRVVFGDGEALREARRIDPSEIPREDALNLVLNRAAEELFARRAVRRAPDSEEAAFAVFYRGIKTVTDVALAVVMARGEHRTSYRGRADRLSAAMAEDASLRAALPGECLEAVDRACRWKIAPEWEALSGHLPGTPSYPENAGRFLDERVALVRGFVAWYAGDSSEPIAALSRSERLPRAARAWVRYGRRSGRAAWSAAGRLLSGRARPSPRLAVQLAALALYLASSEAGDGGGREASRLVPGPRAATARIEDDVLAAWGREIMDWRGA